MGLPRATNETKPHSLTADNPKLNHLKQYTKCIHL